MVVECRGHDAARMQNVDHAHGWESDVVGMLEEKDKKNRVSVSFDCETLKAEEAAEDHINKFMPKLAGMNAVGKQINLYRLPNPFYSSFLPVIQCKLAIFHLKFQRPGG